MHYLSARVRILGLAVIFTWLQVASAADSRPELFERDQLKAAVQQICPVSGKPLGSRGTALKTRIGEEEVFLCCRDCARGPVSREHWATIHANFAKAQGSCPVMQQELPRQAKWTIVRGQIVYVCCPPCIEKIRAEPETYLGRVEQLYRKSLAASSPDQLRMTAQQICPVSGRQLGSMGPPVRTQIGEEELFLCCQDCTSGSISRDHWGTIHANLARAQGRCPVMDKELPANPRWTVVRGRLVYVCCPPCIEKIQADPATWLTKVDELYARRLASAQSGGEAATIR